VTPQLSAIFGCGFIVRGEKELKYGRRVRWKGITNSIAVGIVVDQPKCLVGDGKDCKDRRVGAGWFLRTGVVLAFPNEVID
jgi:hypothetical protein